MSGTAWADGQHGTYGNNRECGNPPETTGPTRTITCNSGNFDTATEGNISYSFTDGSDYTMNLSGLSIGSLASDYPETTHHHAPGHSDGLYYNKPAAVFAIHDGNDGDFTFNASDLNVTTTLSSPNTSGSPQSHRGLNIEIGGLQNPGDTPNPERNLTINVSNSTFDTVGRGIAASHISSGAIDMTVTDTIIKKTLDWGIIAWHDSHGDITIRTERVDINAGAGIYGIIWNSSARPDPAAGDKTVKLVVKDSTIRGYWGVYGRNRHAGDVEIDVTGSRIEADNHAIRARFNSAEGKKATIRVGPGSTIVSGANAAAIHVQHVADNPKASTEVVLEGELHGGSLGAINVNHGPLDLDIRGNGSIVKGDIVSDALNLRVGGVELVRNGSIIRDTGAAGINDHTVQATASGGFTITETIGAHTYVYESLPETLQALNRLPTMRQRLADATDGQGLYASCGGGYLDREPAKTTTDTTWDMNDWTCQLGLRMAANDGMTGNLRAYYGDASADIEGHTGSGDIDTTSYGVSGSVTWRSEDTYVDLQGTAAVHDSDLSRSSLGRVKSGLDSYGFAVAAEAGRSYEWNDSTLTPHFRLTWSRIDTDDFTDRFGNRVTVRDSTSTSGSLGATWEAESVWVAAELQQELGNGSEVNVVGHVLEQRMERTQLQLGVGGNLGLAGGATVQGQLSITTSIQEFGDEGEIRGAVTARF